MPALEASLAPPAPAAGQAAPQNPQVRWRLQVEYQRPQNGGRVHPQDEENFITVPQPAANIRTRAIRFLSPQDAQGQPIPFANPAAAARARTQALAALDADEIGRASCRERVLQVV